MLPGSEAVSCKPWAAEFHLHAQDEYQIRGWQRGSTWINVVVVVVVFRRRMYIFKMSHLIRFVFLVVCFFF